MIRCEPLPNAGTKSDVRVGKFARTIHHARAIQGARTILLTRADGSLGTTGDVRVIAAARTILKTRACHSARTISVVQNKKFKMRTCQFRCCKCKHTWTTESGPTTCPRCGGEKLTWVNYEAFARWYRATINDGGCGG